MQLIRNAAKHFFGKPPRTTAMTKEEFNFDVIGRQGMDLVSGTRGTITSIAELRSGSIQLAIEPNGIFGKPTDAYAYDFQQVVIFDEGSIDARFKHRLPVIVSDPLFQLGEAVKDQISGISGLVTRRTTYMNGCILYSILPEGADGNKVKDSVHVFQPLVESIQDGAEKDLRVDWNVFDLVAEEVEEVEEVTETSPTKPSRSVTGGPAEKAITSSQAH